MNPNNAIHRMPTRVTPRADSGSLRWHESRHGQASVIADVRKDNEAADCMDCRRGRYGGLCVTPEAPSTD